LAYKAKENSILCLDAISLNTPKTSDFAKIIASLKLDNKKTLVVVPSIDKNVYLSSRNLEKTSVQIADHLNTYDIMNSNNVVFVGNAHEVITELLKK